MTLVFLARSRLPIYGVASEECKLAADRYATSVAAITQALDQLEGAFLVKREESGQQCWGFVHPTFADAVSSILSGRPDLVELYLRGAKIETLLAEAVCEGARNVKDAVVVPVSSFDTLVSRLLETPDESNLNELLFLFLNRRAPRDVVQSVLEQAPELLNRDGDPSPWIGIGRHAKVILHAMAYSMNLLEEDTRFTTCQSLEDAALFSLDVSFLSDEGVLAMLRPHESMRLAIKLVAMLEEKIPSKIEETEDEADPDRDIDDQFESVSSFVTEMYSIGDEDEKVNERLDILQEIIKSAKTRVEERKSTDDQPSFFNSVPSAAIAKEATLRSIFSDIDE